MVYGNLDAVKRILNIDEDDVESDEQLTDCQVSAHGEVNNILKSHGITTPLTSPDQNVKDAENYFAASYFRERNDSAEAEKLYNRGLHFLETYMAADESDEIAFIVGVDTS